jgi:tetratricopeptide (TPR) repeat protein
LRLIDEGHVLEAQGRLDEAMQRYQDAIRLAPHPARAHLNLGNVLLAKGDLPGALDAFRTAIKHKPDYAGAYYNIGNALLGNGQFDEAAANYRRALEIQPDYAEVHCSLGVALKELGQLDHAVTSFQRALEINPDLVEAHLNLGNALQAQGKLDYAVASYRSALEIEPNLAEAHSNLGITLQELGQFEGAAESYRRALEIKPDLIDTKFNLGLLLLSMGRYTEAWPMYEDRYNPKFKRRNVILPDVSFPQWQGEPLTGKSLVIWPEQGFGDEIQFARYIPMLKKRGVSRLTLVCTSPLKSLLKKLDGVDTVVSESEAASLPIHDYWVFSMSLPLHFATTVETIPAKLPYLSVLPERLEPWRGRLPADGLKVGLVWKGSVGHKNDVNRSLPGLSTLAPLWSVPSVTFVSLQKEQGENEAATAPAGQPILHLGSEILDFADTACIIAQLDLIICVDTAIAHLAGALRKPCWVLLPARGTDWRWLRERGDTPWYPSVMRLFRQTKPDDWSDSIGEVAQALETWVNEHDDVI